MCDHLIFMGSGKITLVLDFFFFARRSLAFYFLRGTVLNFFARIMRIKTNKKVYYISVDSDLEIDTRLIKCLVL